MQCFRNLIYSLLLLSAMWICSCGEDVQLPSKVLAGTIDSAEWTFTVGKALSDQRNGVYEVELFNFANANQNDGCLLFGGTQPHLSVSIPFNARNNEPMSAIGNRLVFHLDGRNEFTADNGFIEVSFINTTEIRGFISAGSGDRNFVEGFFSVLICN